MRATDQARLNPPQVLEELWGHQPPWYISGGDLVYPPALGMRTLPEFPLVFHFFFPVILSLSLSLSLWRGNSQRPLAGLRTRSGAHFFWPFESFVPFPFVFGESAVPGERLSSNEAPVTRRSPHFRRAARRGRGRGHPSTRRHQRRHQRRARRLPRARPTARRQHQITPEYGRRQRAHGPIALSHSQGTHKAHTRNH